AGPHGSGHVDGCALYATQFADALIEALNLTAASESHVAAEAAANDKAIQDMNEDKVEEWAKAVWLAPRRSSDFYYTEERIQASMREAFNSERYANSRKAYFDIARAAIEHLQGESKWKAVALDLAEHLKRALPTLDDAREDARHLNRQSVVDA